MKEEENRLIELHDLSLYDFEDIKEQNEYLYQDLIHVMYQEFKKSKDDEVVSYDRIKTMEEFDYTEVYD